MYKYADEDFRNQTRQLDIRVGKWLLNDKPNDIEISFTTLVDHTLDIETRKRFNKTHKIKERIKYIYNVYRIAIVIF